MNFKASANYIKRSPYKLRPIIDIIRGKSAQYALDWLKVYGLKKSSCVKKLLESAIANAKNMHEELQIRDLEIAEIRVDEGPTFKYFKPSAQGRSMIMRKRLSHLTIVLKQITIKENQA